MKSDLKECRYNPNHKLKSSRLLSHEVNCPNKNTTSVLVCSFDPSHKVKVGDLDRHEKNCPRRPKEDLEVMKEMEKYIESQIKTSQNAIPSSNNNIENSYDSTNKSFQKSVNQEIGEKNNNVVGLRKNKEKKKILEEEKAFRKLCIEDDVSDDDPICHATYPENNIDFNKDKSVLEEENEKNFNEYLKKDEKFELEKQEYNPNDSECYERNNINESESNVYDNSYVKIEIQEEDSMNMDSSKKNPKDFSKFNSNLIMSSFEMSREGER